VLRREAARCKSEDLAAMVKHVFQAMTTNEPALSKKMAGLKEALGESFDQLHDCLATMSVQFYSQRCSLDEVDSALLEAAVDEKLRRDFVKSFAAFVEYMDSAEAQAEQRVIGRCRLVDFRWEMREQLFDSSVSLPKANLVLAELVYADDWTGRVYRFRCLISNDAIEELARLCDDALAASRQLKESY
jgi:hypothetical protein